MTDNRRKPDADYERDIAAAILHAREVQEFIWADESFSRKPFDAQKWAAVFQKRVDAIAAVDLNSPSAFVELRKRLLQQAALSIKALEVIRSFHDNQT